MEATRTLIADLGEIPTLPAYFNKIMAAIEDEKFSVKDVALIIRNDPSLTSKILKLANSAYYGRFKKVATVDQAVMTIGFNEIKTICLGMGVFGSFDGLMEPDDMKKFWVHAMTSAMAVQAIGDRQQECSLEKIYYGGLMHDIGKLVLLLLYTEDYLDLIDDSPDGAPSLEDEKHEFGVNHAQTGKLLCEHWNFPNELTELITYHHAPNKKQLLRRKSVATVYLADGIAHHGAAVSDHRDATADFCKRMLGITSAEMSEIGIRLDEQRAQIEETFSAMN